MKKNIVLVVAAFIAGCANFNSVHRELNVDEGKGALIDIKQRAIFVSKHVTNNGEITKSKTIICAEPSPDSLSAYAAELAAEASVPEKVTAQLTAAFQESSSFVGLRTQSIQLLRDSLYRLCEGFMSGALDKPKYDILMRRYQKYMVALLAIEQLTGTVKAPAVTINTKGSAEAAQSISSLRSEISLIEQKIVELKNKKTELETKKSKDGVADQEKKEIDIKIAKLDQDITALEADKAVVTKAVENAKGLAVSGEATSTITSIGLPAGKSEQHIQKVSDAVEKIVIKIIGTDDTGQLCWAYLSDAGNNNTLLKNTCLDYINNINKKNEILLKAEEKLLASGNSKKALGADDLNKMIERLRTKPGSGWGIYSTPSFPEM